MEIYKGFGTSKDCLVFFKRKEDCRIFINYLSSLKGVDDFTEPELTRNYSNYLGSFAFVEDWTIIYPAYVLREDVDNFIKLMED
jgi:hypothetical protein